MRLSRMNLLTSCVLAVTLCLFLYPSTTLGEEIVIDVAPNVINIQSQSVVVTVHTDIAYGSVDVSSVYLNGVLINSWKSDLRGNFVAKFLSDDIKMLDGLIIDSYNELKLVGDTTDRVAFSGSQEIRVIDNEPAGKE